MGELEGAIDDPNFASGRLTEPAIGWSAERASIVYPDGKTFWFTREGSGLKFDSKKSYDRKGKPLKPDEILNAQNAITLHLSIQK